MTVGKMTKVKWQKAKSPVEESFFSVGLITSFEIYLGHHLNGFKDIYNIINTSSLSGHWLGQIVEGDLALYSLFHSLWIPFYKFFAQKTQWFLLAWNLGRPKHRSVHRWRRFILLETLQHKKESVKPGGSNQYKNRLTRGKRIIIMVYWRRRRRQFPLKRRLDAQISRSFLFHYLNSIREQLSSARDLQKENKNGNATFILTILAPNRTLITR